jgi:Fe-S oxidoreductase
MTRLKSEVLAHYQAEHGASLRTRLFGRIATVSRLGSATAPVSNWIAGSAPVRWLLDRTLGIDRRRRLPRFERRTFRRRFAARSAPVREEGGPRVWLLPDTFTNHNEPAVGMAAVRILEAAGVRVDLLPLPGGCCGRPMFSKGLLSGARRMAERNLALWSSLVADGTPILGLEPSCILTLTDEYPALVPGAEAEAVAAAAGTIEEWLDRNEDRVRSALAFRSPAGYDESRLLVHGHCHQKALVGTDPMRRVLGWLPDTSVEIIESGCCGMAGSFGYEKEHYDLSLRIGGDRLFGAVEEAGEATVVAPGTSCRSQIAGGTGRRSLHPVEVLAERMEREERPNTP